MIIWRLRRWLISAFEGLTSIVAQPRLLAGSAVAAGLGIGLFVATATVSVTAERQVAASFDVLRATTVTVESIETDGPADWVPTDYVERAHQVAGVLSIQRVADFNDLVVSTASPSKPSMAISREVAIVGINTGLTTPFSGSVVGAAFQDDASLLYPSVLLGRLLADELGISAVDGIQTVWIAGNPFVVRGILSNLRLRPDLASAAIVLSEIALEVIGPPRGIELIVTTEPGAALNASNQLPVVLRPDNPTAIVASAPPDPDRFRGEIEGQVSQALLAVSGIAVVIAAVGIANSMGAAVRSRVPEIGLRRAIGALPTDIFVQMITESLIIGLSGGLIGLSIGTVGAIATARWMGWNPVVAPMIPILGLGIGIALGVVSGILPALRASRIEPVDSLRAF